MRKKYKSYGFFSLGKTDESWQGPMACVFGARLQKSGKSNHSEAPPDGHRSDSTGKLYAFPFQRSSGSVREALHLSRPPEPRNAKIFSLPCRCPPNTHAIGPCQLSVFWDRKVINFLVSILLWAADLYCYTFLPPENILFYEPRNNGHLWLPGYQKQKVTRGRWYAWTAGICPWSLSSAFNQNIF